MVTDSSLSYRIFGTPGAERLVVLVGMGIAVTLDPLPAETAARDICVLAVALSNLEIEDRGSFGSQTPAETTATVLVDLIRETLEATQAEDRGAAESTAGIVAYRQGADIALRATMTLGQTVDRLALVAATAPEERLDRDDLGSLIGGVTADTLVLSGGGDGAAAQEAAAWYLQHLRAARAEIIPGPRLLTLSTVWGRVLTHIAPDTER